MAEDLIFRKYKRTMYNPKFKNVLRRAYKSDIYKIFEEWKQSLIIIFSSLLYRITITYDYSKGLNNNH